MCLLPRDRLSHQFVSTKLWQLVHALVFNSQTNLCCLFIICLLYTSDAADDMQNERDMLIEQEQQDYESV